MLKNPKSIKLLIKLNSVFGKRVASSLCLLYLLKRAVVKRMEVGHTEEIIRTILAKRDDTRLVGSASVTSAANSLDLSTNGQLRRLTSTDG